MSFDENNKIKLIVNNEEDLNVISTYIQDSIVVIKDIVFLKKNKIFLILFNRFIWENLKKNTKNKRIRCALKFEGILDAKSKKINQKDKKKILEFLAIESKKKLDDNYEINFFFSGGGA